MKRKILILLITVISISSFAQDVKKEKKIGLKFSGFVKSDFWFDSRQVAGAREDLFALYPLNESLDANGDDINAHGKFNFSAITSRITAKIAGPDAFGAKTSGCIEADFSGMSNPDINGFRLRHAYLRLNWEKSELLFGQYWHPAFVTEVFPTVISLNTGVPFQPFLRSPQIRYTKTMNKFKIIAAVLSQRDYTNDGSNGRSSEYLRNSGVPDMHLQFQYKGKKNVFGIGGDYKILQPRLVTDSMYITDETMGSYEFLAYWKYTNKKLTVKAKTIYGQNLTDQLMLGGYAVKSVDTICRKEKYTPTLLKI